jgi:hypothetical protein
MHAKELVRPGLGEMRRIQTLHAEVVFLRDPLSTVGHPSAFAFVSYFVNRSFHLVY